MTNKVEKIVILGGGVSGITAAFELSNEADWQSKYDITLYQLGWRNGGKATSGRNMDNHDRIEEHVIHVWLGFYAKSIKAMKACYEELNRPEEYAISNFEEAFHGENSTGTAQKLFDKNGNEQWTTWDIDLHDLMNNIKPLIGKMFSHIDKDIPQPAPRTSSYFDKIFEKIGEFRQYKNLKTAFEALKKLYEDLHNFDYTIENYNSVIERLKEFRSIILNDILTIAKEIEESCPELSLKLTRVVLLLDFGLTIIIGLLSEPLLLAPQNPITQLILDNTNKLNFIEWLEKYGAREITINGPIVVCLYTVFLAYENGDLEKPNFEAGTFLRACLYAIKHSNSNEDYIYLMQAGTGDVMFAPYYEVLKNRGIKFKFFHEVTELKAISGSDGNIISQIKMNQQVRLKNPSEEYNPLIEIEVGKDKKLMPCWPSTPLYDQIEDGIAALLIGHNINLESAWSDWSEINPNQDEDRVVLEAGQDFDRVILNISVAGLAKICPDLLNLNSDFKAMTENISTVATQSIAVWGTETIREMGNTMFEDIGESPECLGYTTQTIYSWADVSYLIKQGTWSAETAPKDIGYFCGVYTPTQPVPDKADPQYPIAQNQIVKDNMIDFCDEWIGLFWPDSQTECDEFNWQLLYAPEDIIGEERVNFQYYRANIDPSERYVQSTTGTSIFRLKTDDSGFNNLYLTGDWIDNGFNMGCIESATISGQQTAKAIMK